jgi:cytochrome c biogenesis protein CcdA
MQVSVGVRPGVAMTRRDGRFDWVLALAIALAVVTTVASRAYVLEGGKRRVDWATLPNHGQEIEGAHAVYFYSPGCGSCTGANEAFARLERSRPDLRVVAYDLSNPAGWADARRTQNALVAGLRVPDLAQNDIPPGLFLPDGYRIGDERVAEAFGRLASASPAELPRFAAPTTGPGDSVLRRGTLGALALAGLADGVNPCALTGLAFLTAYLLHRGSRRRQVALVGLLFSLGTFCAYFAAGLGLYFAIAGSSRVPGGRLAVYAFSAAVCCAFCSYAWWGVARRGMAPAPVSPETRRAEHRLVRWASSGGLVCLGAPALGAAFALLELACTGQVYLPALAVLSSTGRLSDALPGLLVYNAAFALPPLALTAVVVAGGAAVSAPRFAPWAARGRTAVAVALSVLTLALLWEVRHAASML